jgi:hypothetical protein
MAARLFQLMRVACLQLVPRNLDSRRFLRSDPIAIRINLSLGGAPMYSKHIGQADTGCDLDFLQAAGRVPEPEIH